MPYKEDGRIDISKLNWKESIPYKIEEKIRTEYTLDEILDRFRQLPEYIGESRNEYGALELKFSDYEVSGKCNAFYNITSHWDKVMNFYK